MRIIVTFLVFISFLISCKKKSEPTTITTPEPSPTVTVKFQDDVQPIFNTHCNGSYCHGGGADGKYFDTHANVTAVASTDLTGAINHSAGFEPMPQYQPKLRQGEIDTITRWINEGKLNN